MPRTLEYEGRGDWVQERGLANNNDNIFNNNFNQKKKQNEKKKRQSERNNREESVPHDGDHLKSPQAKAAVGAGLGR